MLKAYYVRFRPTAKIDYCMLLSFYDLAEYNIETKCFDTIHYTSVRELAERLKVSQSTVNRLFANAEYNEFMKIDREKKTIMLYNNFGKGIKDIFVRLTAEEAQLIKEMNDNLFSKYLIYLKYYCGYTKNNTDFTAKQFLIACGYSVKSNNTFDKISGYNRLLVKKGLVSINIYRDELGHTRNNYFYN